MIADYKHKSKVNNGLNFINKAIRISVQCRDHTTAASLLIRVFN